jgi:hypothetical protein
VSSPACLYCSSIASTPSEHKLSIDISTLTVLEKRVHTIYLNKEKKEALKESQKTTQDSKATKKALVDTGIMCYNEVSNISEDKTPRVGNSKQGGYKRNAAKAVIETPALKKHNVGCITRSNLAKTSSRTTIKLKGLTKA